MGVQVNPELKALVAEASQALAVLDADRLEALAVLCQQLTGPAANRVAIARQVRDASLDMAVLARVLEATRENLAVMRRLLDLREGRMAYGDPMWTGVGAADGHN